MLKLKLLFTLGAGAVLVATETSNIINNVNTSFTTHVNKIDDMFDNLSVTSKFNNNDQTYKLSPSVVGGTYKFIKSTGNLSISRDGTITLPKETFATNEYILNFSYTTKQSSDNYSFSWFLDNSEVPDVTNLTNTTFYDGKIQTFNGLTPTIAGGEYTRVSADSGIDIALDGTVTLDATALPQDYNLKFTYKVSWYEPIEKDFVWHLETGAAPDVTNLTNTTFYDGKAQTFNGLTPTITGGKYTRASADAGIDIASDGTITLDATAKPKDYNLSFTYIVSGYQQVTKDFVWHLETGVAPDVTNLTNTTFYDGKVQTFNGLKPTIAGGIYTRVSADAGIDIVSDGTISLASTAKPKDYNLKFTYTVDGYAPAQKDFVWHLKVEMDGVLLKTNGTKITFNSSNTPMSNFCSQIGDFVINSQNISRKDIKNISFGNSYLAITEVDNDWLWYCSSLISIDFNGLTNLLSVGDNWLYGCTSLTSVDFSPLSNLVSVGNDWLSVCSAITSVNFSKLSKLKSVGNDWLLQCSQLETIDFGKLTKLSSIGNNWLAACSSLTSINFNGLANLTSVGNNWLISCSSLISIDFNGLTNLTSVGDSWLYDCSKITTINFNGLTNLSSISYEWLHGCISLTSIDFSELINLSSVGDNWLYGCTNIQTISVGNISWIERKFIDWHWVGFSTTNFALKCPKNGTIKASSNDNGQKWIKAVEEQKQKGETWNWNVVLS